MYDEVDWRGDRRDLRDMYVREIRVRVARVRREEWRVQVDGDWRGFEESSDGITPPWTVVSDDLLIVVVVCSSGIVVLGGEVWCLVRG